MIVLYGLLMPSKMNWRDPALTVRSGPPCAVAARWVRTGGRLEEGMGAGAIGGSRQ